jgi:hypothetical protein
MYTLALRALDDLLQHMFLVQLKLSVKSLTPGLNSVSANRFASPDTKLSLQFSALHATVPGIACSRHDIVAPIPPDVGHNGDGFCVVGEVAVHDDDKISGRKL